ncbi:hypothetical protein NU219Hw_g2916t1 [Hortaea werneckii]
MPQRRTFFNLGMFRKPRRERKEADMDPGIEKMMELEKLQRMRARPPPQEEVKKALRDFVYSKQDSRTAMEDTQARLVLLSLKHCLESLGEGPEALHQQPQEAVFATKFYKALTYTLGRPPRQVSDAHLELARYLFELFRSGNAVLARGTATAYCKIWCYAGNPNKALELLQSIDFPLPKASMSSELDAEEHQEEGEVVDPSMNQQQTPTSDPVTPVLLHTLRTFVSMRDSSGVERTLAIMQDRGARESYHTAACLVEMAIVQGDADRAQRHWKDFTRLAFAELDQSRNSPSGVSSVSSNQKQVIDKLLQWCMKVGHLDLGHEVVRDVMQDNPPKPIWDAVFVWAAGTGKGVDEVGRMFDVMESSNDGISPDDWRTADAATINGLVELAISKDDPYMAERFIALGRERGIEPDAKTLVLQMDYRLSVNDIDGALTAYKNLQYMDLSGDEDLPVVNRLIVAISSSKRHDFDTVMNVVADLSDRQARFEPLTTSTLALLHLNRDEIHDVIDLLNTHAYHYSSTERTSIRDALVSYCLDLDTPTSRAWDAYSIIRDVFDELPREPRTELMSSFFRRQRPDMAVHVFNHMRTHSRADTIPTIDTYISAFLGTARLRDLESLEVVHNQLKLDFNINITTPLRNALIIAYTACSRPRKALGFWDDIVASREGPSYNSLHIALRACEKSPFGDLKAKEIWEKLRKMNVDLDSTMWASYVAALAGNGNVAAACKTVEDADADRELDVDPFVLGSLFAGAPGFDRQGDVEAWARAKYPREWADLEKLGCEEDEAGTRAFYIDRSVTP